MPIVVCVFFFKCFLGPSDKIFLRNIYLCKINEKRREKFKSLFFLFLFSLCSFFIYRRDRCSFMLDGHGGESVMKLLTESEKIHTFRIIFIRLLSLCFGLCVDAAMSTNSNSFFFLSSSKNNTPCADELWCCKISASLWHHPAHTQERWKSNRKIIFIPFFRTLICCRHGVVYSLHSFECFEGKLSSSSRMQAHESVRKGSAKCGFCGLFWHLFFSLVPFSWRLFTNSWKFT